MLNSCFMLYIVTYRYILHTCVKSTARGIVFNATNNKKQRAGKRIVTNNIYDHNNNQVNNKQSIPELTSQQTEAVCKLTGKRPVGKIALRMSSHIMAAVPQKTSDPNNRRPSKVSRTIHLPFACQAQQNVPQFRR